MPLRETGYAGLDLAYRQRIWFGKQVREQVGMYPSGHLPGHIGGT